MKYWRCFIGMVMIFAVVGLVQAHQMVVTTVPAAGAKLVMSPPEVRLGFERPLGADSTFVVLNSQFVQIPEIDVLLTPSQPLLMSAFLPTLEPDTYTVQWVAIDVDGHPTSGSYQFTLLAGGTPQTTARLPLGGGELGVALIGIILFFTMLVGYRRRLRRRSKVAALLADQGRRRSRPQ